MGDVLQMRKSDATLDTLNHIQDQVKGARETALRLNPARFPYLTLMVLFILSLSLIAFFLPKPSENTEMAKVKFKGVKAVNPVLLPRDRARPPANLTEEEYRLWCEVLEECGIPPRSGMRPVSGYVQNGVRVKGYWEDAKNARTKR